MLAVSQLQRGDVAIGFTYSGASKTILDIMAMAKKRGAVTAGITGYSESPLAKTVSIPLCYSTKVEDDLRYLHVARMCELSIIGLIQSEVLNIMPEERREKLLLSQSAIKSVRNG